MHLFSAVLLSAVIPIGACGQFPAPGECIAGGYNNGFSLPDSYYGFLPWRRNNVILERQPFMNRYFMNVWSDCVPLLPSLALLRLRTKGMVRQDNRDIGRHDE
ncbi:hypothetical protein EYB66_04145 [Akkermansia muciniphila]|uniref:hypothetical protein n=1 Tax=Akkermansia muciniphila TaxID=239935 RepID=UPI000C9B8063|nr:hypothetical protein [Akkermansia muciniphila]PNC83628.1 hypothetical protein CXT93_08885 [Akkermansia muciniphila]PNC97649.1 hypothetical protein CXT87_09685 [Akkermansia muciniphila]PND06466.1 hypothetical protein CXT86_03735 [Akkermansia muciniphila]PND10814.1 hypothetical protein CXT85_04505 [Akkermansia muciniphila]QBH16510.1 hypothetical protein EYB66_04145 [Akkermansia muciniphila]